MTSRAYDIMGEVAAVFGAVAGLTPSSIEIGYKNPANIPEGELPKVLIYNPTTAQPNAPVYGLRSVEYGFAVLLVNKLETDEATLQLCEDLAIALGPVAFVMSDIAFMNPGSTITDTKRQRALVGSFLIAQWEGV